MRIKKKSRTEEKVKTSKYELRLYFVNSLIKMKNKGIFIG